MREGYSIKDIDNNFYIQWDRKTIVFDNEDDVKEFIDSHYYLFKDVEYTVTPPPEDDSEDAYDYFISFNDVRQHKDYEDTIIYKE